MKSPVSSADHTETCPNADGTLSAHYLFFHAPTPTWIEDFSEIKRIFDQIRSSGATDFRAHFEAHPDDVRRCAEALKVLDANQASLNLLKASSFADLATHLPDYFLDESWVVFREELIALAQGGLLFESDIPLRIPAGSRIVVHLTLTVIPEYAGTLSRVIVSFTDITAQTRLTKALRESEERFRTLLRGIPSVSVQGYNADGNVIFWNEASTRLYGYTNAEALGRNLIDLIIPPPMKEAVKGAIASMVESLVPIPAGPLELMRKDGTLVPVYSSHAVMMIPDHGFELYCLDIDLSELKRTEAALAAEKTTSILLQQRLQQAAKMDAIGRLAGGVAHDFNNLLQAILGFTEIVMEKTQNTDSHHDDLLQIKRAGVRAADLTRQLLAFSRKQMVEPRVINVNANVAAAHKMLQRLLGEDISLQAIPDPQLRPIKADPGQIDQVILNLAVNARDAMPSGGRLTIRTTNVTLEEEDAASMPEAHPGAFVCLSVSDTGTGMDAEVQGHLFEPFFTTKEKGKGSGLGLAVIYGILKQNHGWVSVYSRVGQGSTFNLYFPAYAGVEALISEHAATSTPPLAPPCGHGEVVLLIEDDPAVRELAAKALTSHGYAVLQGESSREAVSLFERHQGRIALLFSDVVLPGENGIDLAERLIALKRDLPVLLTSGYADERARWNVIEARGYHFLQKPYPIATLLRAVRELLDAARGGPTPATPTAGA